MARPRGESTGRARLAEAAGRGFRIGGFGGVGVDALASEAGLTSGAFYAHFGSKAKAFRVAVEDGLDALIKGVERFRAEHGSAWLDPFVDFYLGERMGVELAQACALPTLSADVVRADDETRRVYAGQLARLARVVAEGFGDERAEERAMSLLAILSGAATMARAVNDEPMRRLIIESARQTAKMI